MLWVKYVTITRLASTFFGEDYAAEVVVAGKGSPLDGHISKKHLSDVESERQ